MYDEYVDYILSYNFDKNLIEELFHPYLKYLLQITIILNDYITESNQDYSLIDYPKINHQ